MKYKIYQIKKDCEARKYLFMSLEYMRFNGYQPRLEDYTLVYEDTLAEGEGLDHIYSRFNMGKNPDDFKGHIPGRPLGIRRHPPEERHPPLPGKKCRHLLQRQADGLSSAGFHPLGRNGML